MPGAISASGYIPGNQSGKPKPYTQDEQTEAMRKMLEALCPEFVKGMG